MINSIEVMMLVEDALPEICCEIPVNKKNDVYEIMDSLFNFTCKNIENQNFKVIKRCFKIVDKLYNKGNKSVKSAIENVFVYSFTKLFQKYPAEKVSILAIIPITLYTIYMKQVYHVGC